VRARHTEVAGRHVVRQRQARRIGVQLQEGGVRRRRSGASQRRHCQHQAEQDGEAQGAMREIEHDREGGREAMAEAGSSDTTTTTKTEEEERRPRRFSGGFVFRELLLFQLFVRRCCSRAALVIALVVVARSLARSPPLQSSTMWQWLVGGGTDAPKTENYKAEPLITLAKAKLRCASVLVLRPLARPAY